jgi:vacuolar-type H+-ATPase subunit H
MTAPDGSPPHDALGAVRRLESALEERTGADTTEAALDAAREEADRLLADARAAGDDEGRGRRAALLAAADAEATSIRAAGEAEADELLRRVAAERDDELVAEFTAAVLPREA